MNKKYAKSPTLSTLIDKSFSLRLEDRKGQSGNETRVQKRKFDRIGRLT